MANTHLMGNCDAHKNLHHKDLVAQLPESAIDTGIVPIRQKKGKIYDQIAGRVRFMKGNNM